MVWHDMIRHDMVWHGMVWHGMVWHDIRYSKLGVKLNDMREREALHGVRGERGTGIVEQV